MSSSEISSSSGEDDDVSEFNFEYLLVKRLINPFTVARILIQLGYEPLSPTPTYLPFKIFSGYITQPFLVYPNLLTYTVNCVSAHGFWKILTTGFIARHCMDLQKVLLRKVINRAIIKPLVKKPIKCPNDSSLDQVLCEVNFSDAIKSVLKFTGLRMVEVILTQPFYVVFVHQVASLVSNDDSKYTLFFNAVPTIFKTSGIAGFFAGLAPRLICEISSTLYCIGIGHLIYNMLNRKDTSYRHRKSTGTEILLILRSLLITNVTSACVSLLFYPYEVTSCIMSVQKSELPLVDSMDAPLPFRHWTDCLNFLQLSGHMYRGLRPIYRTCVKPKPLLQLAYQ